MAVDYTNIPDRLRGESAGFDFPGQPKWDLPEACVIKVAVVGRPPNRKGSPARYSTSPVPFDPSTVPTDAEMKATVEQNMRCIEAGACCVHYHAIGETPQDWVRQWHLFCDPIKAKYGNDVVCDLSLCTRNNWEEEKYLIKEMADLCEFTPVNISLGGTGMGKKFLQAEIAYCQENGVVPELACYIDGDIDRARSFLIDTGVYKPPVWWDILPYYSVGGTPFYNFSAMALTLISHIQQIRQITPECGIMYTGSGRASSHLTAVAMMLGCHIKVGMEDVYYWHPNKDDVLDDNLKSVEHAVTLAKSLGRRPATANEFRAFAGMPTKK